MQIRCPDDYRQWLVSMFSLFGTKWVKLFCGPMWKVESMTQCASLPVSPGLLDPMQVCYDVDFFCSSFTTIHTQARVNVPGLSERQLERDIVGSEMSTGSEIQVHANQLKI